MCTSLTPPTFKIFGLSSHPHTMVQYIPFWNFQLCLWQEHIINWRVLRPSEAEPCRQQTDRGSWYVLSRWMLLPHCRHHPDNSSYRLTYPDSWYNLQCIHLYSSSQLQSSDPCNTATFSTEKKKKLMNLYESLLEHTGAFVGQHFFNKRYYILHAFSSIL